MASHSLRSLLRPASASHSCAPRRLWIVLRLDCFSFRSCVLGFWFEKHFLAGWGGWRRRNTLGLARRAVRTTTWPRPPWRGPPSSARFLFNTQINSSLLTSGCSFFFFFFKLLNYSLHWVQLLKAKMVSALSLCPPRARPAEIFSRELPFLSPRLQGPFFCFCNLFPEPTTQPSWLAFSTSVPFFLFSSSFKWDLTL